MNEYRITYSTADGEAEYSIIERSEAAAQKAFKAEHKGAEVSGIELTDTDAVATKRQQLETLEKIKAMVAELGPQSYLKTAFAGVFEDAETNIENDFGFSMKARYESAERKLREMGSDLRQGGRRPHERGAGRGPEADCGPPAAAASRTAPAGPPGNGR